MNEQKLTGYPHIDRPWMKYYDSSLIHLEDPKVNLTSYLKNKTKGLDDRIEAEYYGRKITYAEFWNKVDMASRVFTSLKMKQNEIVMFLVPNIPESGELWLGASQIGLISDFVDPRPDSLDYDANSKKLLELVKKEKVNHIIALDICYLTMLKPIENELVQQGIKRIILVSIMDSMSFGGRLKYLSDLYFYSENKDNLINKIKFLIEKNNERKKLHEKLCKAIRTSSIEVVWYSELKKNVRTGTFSVVYDKNMVNYIGHTSGTSGSMPKPICLTNENHISSTEQLLRASAEYKIGERVIHELPFFSPLGADNNYIFNIACGAVNIEIPEFKINDFGYLIKKYRPNVILGTPSWLASLTKCDYLDKTDLSCITRIIYGGDSMTEYDEHTLNCWLEKHGCKVKVRKGHGMSEFCGCGSYAKDPYNKYESIGIPLPNTIYTVVNPEIEDRLEPVKFFDHDERVCGELAVSSNAVTPGILFEEVIIPKYTLEGNTYMRTRDIVEMDRDGIFYFKSRKDRSFTRFDGYKIKPYEIEKEIEQNTMVKYCHIVPYYDESQKGFMPKANIVLFDGVTQMYDYKWITENIIQKNFIENKNISSRQIPSKIKYRESLPLTKNSKVDFSTLIKEELDGSEISIEVEETNLSIGTIAVKMP